MGNRTTNHTRASGTSARSLRRFTVFDEMILIALVAAVIAVTGVFWESDLREFIKFRPAQSWVLEVLDWAPFLLVGLLPRYIAAAMPAVLALRLRRPRPPLRKLARQPGCVACAAGSAALVAGGVLVLSWTMFRENVQLVLGPFAWPSMESYVAERRISATATTVSPFVWPAVESYVAAAVLAAWAVLLLGGRWRSEPTWIDRAGRVCGAYWVFLVLYRWVLLIYLPTW